MIEEYLLRLEKNLMVGSARWVADFRESFRGYQVEGARFDMMVRGGMKAKGFLLSRLFSFLVMPNYQVACFVYSQDLEANALRNLVKGLLEHIKEIGVDWAWLVIPKEGGFPHNIQRLVESIDYRELGIALVDVTSQEIVNSSSYVGKRMRDHVKCFR